MTDDLATLLIPVLVAILGWLVGHELNLRRDTIIKRRELRVKYLLEAFRNLEASVGHTDGVLSESRKVFNSAVSDIQLLGTKEQIDALVNFLEGFKKNTNGSVDTVFNLLRDEIRKELDLERNVKPYFKFMFHD